MRSQTVDWSWLQSRMEEEDKQPLKEEKSLLQEEKEEAKKAEAAEAEASPAKSGGWGGWGFSSVFSDLQKAAEEISRNVSVSSISQVYMNLHFYFKLA